MSEYNKKLLKIYEEEKDLPNPPSYLQTIKEILEIDGLIKEE